MPFSDKAVETIIAIGKELDISLKEAKEEFLANHPHERTKVLKPYVPDTRKPMSYYFTMEHCTNEEYRQFRLNGRPE